MKIIIDRAELMTALGHVQSVVERRNTIPILANVKLEAKKNALNLTATDMDVAVVENVPCKAEKAGSITVPAHTLYDIIRKLPDGSEVSMETKDSNKLQIKAGSSRFALPTLPVEDFPVMAEGNFSHEFTLTVAECRELFDKTRFAISTEETRYYLNGVYLHVAGDEDARVLRAAATDGHRLARTEVALPAGAEDMPGVIIPRKTVAEVRKLLDTEPEEVKFSLSDSMVRFVCGKATFVSKLIDGTFPDYERVIPFANDKVMELDGKAFYTAVDRVSTISSDKTRGIKLKLDTGTLTLSADNDDNGDATENIDVSYTAAGFEIGFNSRYLLDMMSQVEGDTVQFVLSDGSSPALVRDPADVGALYVIMPMRI